MYQIFFDNYPLYDPRDEELIIRDPSPRLAVGEAGEMGFIIDHDHPYASKLTRLKGIVSLQADGVPIFKGRIRKDTQGFNLSREIEVEGLLACLNDSVIPPFNFPDDFLDNAEYQAAAESGNVIQFFLGWVLDQHNSQVGTAQRVLLGDVTVSDPNNYHHCSSGEYLTAMEVIRKKLEDMKGGYLLADYSGATTVLHYYADLPLTNVQEVEFGENLLALTSILDAAETYTAILPLGSDGLTIESLEDSEIAPGFMKQGKIIYSVEAEEAIGGRITKTVKWDDVAIESNLQAKALAVLSGEGVMTSQTIDVTAADLGGTNDVSRFVVGRHVRLISTPHGFGATYPLMELEPDIFNPGNTQITLGATTKTASDIQHAQKNAVEERLDQYRLDLNRQEVNASERVRILETQITEAIQTSEQILLAALERYVETGDYDTFKRETEGQLKLLSDQMIVNFTETTASIENVNGDLQQTIETLSKYFVFDLDGLTIKTGEHSMQLKLDNDLIAFTKDGQPFGYWDGVDFHTGNIVIDVNERAQFGDFAFIPRSDGSLMFLKVR